MLAVPCLCVVAKMSTYDLATAESPAYAPFFGYMGAASAQIFTVFGAAYGTAKSAVGISSVSALAFMLHAEAIYFRLF